MNSPSSFWVSRYAKPIIFLILTLAMVGVYVAFTIPVAVFPSTNFPRVVIGVDNGVMPIDQMLVTVTRPIELAVNSVQGLQQVRSTTSRGSAEVDLFFDWNVDMFQTLQRVNAAVARVQPELPPTARIATHRLSFASFPILGYSLTSKTVPQSQLWELANYDLKPRLNRQSGVSDVTVQGGQEPEFQVTPDPAKMLAASVTVNDLLDAVRRTNIIASPGLIDQQHQLFLGLVNSQVRTPAGIANIVVKATPGGTPIRVGDVATVAPSFKPVYTIVTANGQPSVLLNIFRQPDTNTLQVANEIHAEIAQIQRTLPPGIQIQSFYDQSTLVQDSIHSVRDAILLGLILASIVLVLFLRDWGSSLVAGLVIPVTILTAFIAMKLLGQSFNLMTLGGLAAAVGLVIDDAIVVVENIVLHRDAGQPRSQAIRSALQEITVPLVGSTITPIVVFLPLISMTGVTGVFFRALAITVSVSLLASLLLALTWTPTLSQFLLRGHAHGEAAAPTHAADEEIGLTELLAAEEASISGFFRGVMDRYEHWLRSALRRPWWLLGFSLLLIAASWFCYKGLGSDMLPAMDEGGFVLDYVMPAGSSLQETNRVVTHIEQILHSIPEVASMSRRTGLQLGLAAVTEANTGDISVRLKTNRSRGIGEIIAEARARVAAAEPGIDVEFTQVLQDTIGDLTSSPRPVEIKLFSPDARLLQQWAPRVATAIGKDEGVVDIMNGIDDAVSGPAFEFHVDPQRALQAGFTPEEVATDAQAMVEGVPAPTPVVAKDRTYTIRVRFPAAARMSMDSLRNTLLVSASGHTATLGSLAAVTQLPPQLEVRSENLQRVIAVSARLEGVDLGTGIREVRQSVEELHLPPSIRVAYGGTYAEQQRSFRSLLMVLVLAVVLVFAVLLLEFRSFSAPVAILSSALLSTCGVFVALLITGTTFNIASFMGLIMVIGIVAKNGILLLDAEQNFRGLGMAPLEAMVQAGRRRLRPITMTAVAAIAGMLPLAFALGAGSQMLQPLAIAVVGGILISMALSLIITPAVFYYLAHRGLDSQAKGTAPALQTRQA